LVDRAIITIINASLTVVRDCSSGFVEELYNQLKSTWLLVEQLMTPEFHSQLQIGDCGY
jgi:hypothetical protein